MDEPQTIPFEEPQEPNKPGRKHGEHGKQPGRLKFGDKVRAAEWLKRWAGEFEANRLTLEQIAEIARAQLLLDNITRATVAGLYGSLGLEVPRSKPAEAMGNETLDRLESRMIALEASQGAAQSREAGLVNRVQSVDDEVSKQGRAIHAMLSHIDSLEREVKRHKDALDLQVKINDTLTARLTAAEAELVRLRQQRGTLSSN